MLGYGPPPIAKICPPASGAEGTGGVESELVIFGSGVREALGAMVGVGLGDGVGVGVCVGVTTAAGGVVVAVEVPVRLGGVVFG